jgi:hypothetical protein
MIVFESLDQFLNENLGTLKQFADIPDEWKKKLLEPGKQGGRESIVDELPASSDYKTFLKKLKDETLLIAIIKVDGKSTYMIEKISPNKFQVKKAAGEYSEIKKRREKEKAIEAEKQAKETKQNESFNPPKVDEINERWGHGGRRNQRGYDSADVGEMSVPQLQEWLENQKKAQPNSNYQIFLIFKDPQRIKKRQERNSIRSIEDPLAGGNSTYRDDKSQSQKDRYEIFAEKKRAVLDKQLDKVLDNFKQQLIDNFDKSMEKIIYDMRRGYSWNMDSKKIGETLMTGVDMTEIKKFSEAYDAIEPSGTSDSAKASKKLKDLGFGSKNESVNEWFVEDSDVDGDGKEEHANMSDPNPMGTLLDLTEELQKISSSEVYPAVIREKMTDTMLAMFQVMRQIKEKYGLLINP